MVPTLCLHNCSGLLLSRADINKLVSLNIIKPIMSGEVQSRDMIRILSHAEIFSFAALKCLQSGNMDSRVFMEP